MEVTEANKLFLMIIGADEKFGYFFVKHNAAVTGAKYGAVFCATMSAANAQKTA